MLAIAEKIVEQQAGTFDPSEFVGRYEDALRELIEAKKKGNSSTKWPQIGRRKWCSSEARKGVTAGGARAYTAPSAPRPSAGLGIGP